MQSGLKSRLIRVSAGTFFVNFDISKIFSYMYDWIHTIKQYGSYGCRRVNCKDKKIH